MLTRRRLVMSLAKAESRGLTPHANQRAGLALGAGNLRGSAAERRAGMLRQSRRGNQIMTAKSAIDAGVTAQWRSTLFVSAVVFARPVAANLFESSALGALNRLICRHGHFNGIKWRYWRAS